MPTQNSAVELSVVVPVYNEEPNIDAFYNRLKPVLENNIEVPYEIIFIDDGSVDESWKEISECAKVDPCIRALRFVRNFGNQFALKAGIDHAEGSAIVTIDADLQQPPELIFDLWKKWKEGHDVVYGKRKDTIKAGLFKKITSKLFYRIIQSISTTKLEHGMSDFRLIDRKVALSIKKVQSKNLFLRGFIDSMGYRWTSVDYIAEARHGGRASTSVWKLCALAINGITYFSVVPIRIATSLGFMFSALAFLVALYILVSPFGGQTSSPGWMIPLIVVLFIGGVQLICLGVIGEYIGKLFLDAKREPLYVIEEEIRTSKRNSQ